MKQKAPQQHAAGLCGLKKKKRKERGKLDFLSLRIRLNHVGTMNENQKNCEHFRRDGEKARRLSGLLARSGKVREMPYFMERS